MSDMERKINVLGVWADNCSAKDAMRACVDYSDTDALNVIEILTADVLVQSKMTDGVKQNIEEADLVLVGDKVILEAAGIRDHQKLQEVEKGIFLKMFLRFLCKSGRRLFLVADSREELDEFHKFLKSHHPDIRIVGEAVVPEDDREDDMILNQINGLEVDCILSELSVDKQEGFIVRNRNLLNARIWMRTGKAPGVNFHVPRFGNTLVYLFRKYILLKEIEREKRKKENG